MRRTVLTPAHEEFRAVIRAFIAEEVVPHHDAWERAGRVPRALYRRLGELGVFGIEVPEEYGGSGLGGFTYHAVLTEECARAGVGFGSASAHTSLCLPYLLRFASDEQKKRWLPGFVAGTTMFALAMTEPGTGSDLTAIRTTAVPSPDGTHYVLNGAKTFITGGAQADRVLVCCRTPPAGMSLLAVDTSSEGFTVGRTLAKLGLHSSDTAELFFSDVRVPVADLLGEEGRAFRYLAHNLPQERLGIAIRAAAQAAAAVRFTAARLRERTAEAGDAPGDSAPDRDGTQHARFVLADCAADVEAARAVADRALAAHEAGELTTADSASAKLFCTETAGRVVDRCLQLHLGAVSGDGIPADDPVTRLCVDTRVTRIYGGTSEVMRTIVAKGMGL